MELIISEYVSFYQKYNPFELCMIKPEDYNIIPAEMLGAILFGNNPTRIRIKDTWYDVLSISQAIRSASTAEPGFHFLYIQINWATNEYYIGKVNRKRWSEVMRYQGSGLKFTRKFKAHKGSFARYLFACCKTAKETETLEASIVDEQLLEDPMCLNLVCGGGGTNEHNSEGKREKQRAYMKSHPEQYAHMVETAKEMYQSGNSAALEQRSQAIRETMSKDVYRDMMSERIRRWKSEHPDEYVKAREKNKEANNTPESKEKRKTARQKWIQEHPQEYEEYQKRLIASRTSPEANKKRATSLSRWYETHPEEAYEITHKRAEASAEKRRRPVHMCDLETGAVIRTFDSQLDAAQWLVDNGIAKNTNCKSSISEVCLKKPCSTGYGYRKKAYGFGWRFADQD